MLMEDLRVKASLQGIDLDKAVKEGTKKQSATKGLMFGDPKDYENMIKAERKELTNKMKSKIKGTLGSALKG